jgi:hypothetical protein
MPLGMGRSDQWNTYYPHRGGRSSSPFGAIRSCRLATASSTAADDPHLTRSSLHRCLQRHVIGRLPEVDGYKPERKRVDALVAAVPYKTEIILTDNNIPFADLPKNRSGPTALFSGHPSIEHAAAMASSTG